MPSTINGGVYMLQLRESGQVLYVGSTSNYSARESAHRSCSRSASTTLHATIAALATDDLTYDDIVEFVRVTPTDISLTRRERALLEQRQIDLTQPQFNQNRAHAPRGDLYFKEYRIANREHIRQYMQEYRETHRSAIRLYAKVAREKAKRTNPGALNAYHRRYRAANKEKTREYMQQYRAANREKVNTYAKAWREKTKAARILASLAGPEVPEV